MKLQKKLLRLFNIKQDEVSRVLFAWMTKFSFYVGYITMWTMLISLLVAKMGIHMLPSLFIINALFIIIGTGLCAKMLKRVGVRKNMIFLSLLGVALMSLVIFTGVLNPAVSYVLALITYSLCFAQTKIRIQEFFEDMFTPSEGPRVFPIIESAETIGGIAAGFLAVTISRSFAVENLIIAPMISLGLVVTLLSLYTRLISTLPKFSAQKAVHKDTGIVKHFKKQAKDIMGSGFLMPLMTLILCNFLIHQLMEFQLTNILSIGSSGADHIAEGFGGFQMAFGVTGLIFQLLLTSRIINRFGVATSMFLHPIMSLISVVGVFFNMSYPMIFASKLSFESTHVVDENAYHSSLYVVPKAMRGGVKHFFEGIAAPIGTLIGTLAIIASTSIFPGQQMSQSMMINLVVCACLIYMAYTAYGMKRSFTKAATANLESESVLAQIDSIELLAERGHDKSLDVTGMLVAKLKSDEVENAIKIGIIKALGNIRDEKSIPTLIDCLKDKNAKIRNEALRSLERFDNLADMYRNLGFAKERIKKMLLKLMDDPEYKSICRRVINLYSKIFSYESAPFITHLLRSNKEDVRSMAIVICRAIDDPEVIPIIKPYVYDTNIRFRASAISALWHFKQLRPELELIIDDMIKKYHNRDISMLLRLIADVKKQKYVPFAKKFIHHDVLPIRKNAIYCLAKLGDRSVARFLVELMFHEKREICEEAQDVFRTLSSAFQRSVRKLMHTRASGHIHEIMSETFHRTLGELHSHSLCHLKRAYVVMGEYTEVAKVDRILREREDHDDGCQHCHL